MLIDVRCVAGPAVVAAVAVLIVGGTASAQQPDSADSPVEAQASDSSGLATELAAALEAAQLDSIAAKDTEGEDRFVAALVFPGQLLVVSAAMTTSIYVEEKIAARNYRDVYIDLNTASISESKVLITDSGADGLRDGDAADSADTGGTFVRFSGEWEEQQLSESDYTSLTSEASTGYARMLRALLAEVN